MTSDNTKNSKVETNPPDFLGKLYLIFMYPINLLKIEQRIYKTRPKKEKFI